MRVNWNKTKEMLLGSITKQSIPDLSVDAMSSTVIHRVRSFKLLGVIIEDNLKWNNHVDFICKKASSRLYLLNVLKRSSVSATDMLHFYTTAIMPVLEYACPAWHNSLNTEQSCRIESVQKPALKIIYGL